MQEKSLGKQVMIQKADGTKELFDPIKLHSSLLRAGAEEGTADKVMAHIISELKDGMTTFDIYNHAFKYLAEYVKPVAEKYAIRKALMNLGPTGFPFEDLVADLLRSKGFEVLTRQTVLGGCVPHEVDVVAWNEKDLIMIEAKYHNELVTKSDLKVALYVKARFDDLKANVYDYGGKERKVTSGWLITNTKFSSTAIHYGLCQKLVMIGWNYPEKGNLQDMIEDDPKILELVLNHSKTL